MGEPALVSTNFFMWKECLNNVMDMMNVQKESVPREIQTREVQNDLKIVLEEIGTIAQRLLIAIHELEKRNNPAKLKNTLSLLETKFNCINEKITNLFDMADKGRVPYCNIHDRDETKRIVELIRRTALLKAESRDPTWTELKLYAEQLKIKGTTQNCFEEGLRTVSHLVKNNQAFRKTNLFISYAWPSPTRSYERWVQPFLSGLRRHMQLAGQRTLLDIEDSDRNMFEFMERLSAKEVGVALLIGTESLLDKHISSGTKACQTEMNLIRGRREDTGFDLIPFVISGTMKDSLPIGFHGYYVVDSITESPGRSYTKVVKNLLERCFSVPENGMGRRSWDIVWKRIFEKIREAGNDWMIDGLGKTKVESVVEATGLFSKNLEAYSMHVYPTAQAIKSDEELLEEPALEEYSMHAYSIESDEDSFERPVKKTSSMEKRKKARHVKHPRKQRWSGKELKKKKGSRARAEVECGKRSAAKVEAECSLM